MMVSLERSSSFLAYTYESDEENDDDEDCFRHLCGCQDEAFDDESQDDDPIHVGEATRLVNPKTMSGNQARTIRRNRIQQQRLVGGSVGLVLFILIFCEYYFLARSSGADNQSEDAWVANSGETLVLKIANDTIVRCTSSIEYGEVWLIRHGEKDSIPHFAPEETNEERLERIHAMYELSSTGKERANHLGDLVQQGKWPRFSSLFASRPATKQQAQEAYPEFARDGTGQSLVRREYQTLLPIWKQLQIICTSNETDCDDVKIANTIHAQFAKGDIDTAGLEIVKTAIQSGSANNRNKINDGSSQRRERNIVLVSWDHCSLPTLVVRGFGCHEDPRCYRCWPDDRFGDVLRLNVSLVTTNRTIEVANTENSLSQEFTVSSTILDMTGEIFPTDQYHEEYDSADRSNNSLVSLSTATRMSIEKSTPCIPSYCSARPAAKHLIHCSCWDE